VRDKTFLLVVGLLASCSRDASRIAADAALPRADADGLPTDAAHADVDAAAAPACEPASAGNPFAEGWYADPDMRVYGQEYWVYPTYSAPYEQQTFLDAFSSPDLIHWTKHARVLDTAGVSWATRAIWAPSPIFRNGKYYLYFGANDIQSNGQLGGIGVATANDPAGPFVDALGHPLIGQFANGAQPIDQNVFVDDDGQAYLYYGGWGHCNVVELGADMTSLGHFADGTTYKEITPPGYVEGALMFKRNGTYYLMWSEGGWTGPDYRVSYAMSSSPTGPFARLGTILSQNAAIGTGSGHNTVVNVPGSDDWYIFYHRHPLGESDGNHRVLAYDRMRFAADGKILPVEMTTQDNFCDGNAIGWSTQGGHWTVADGHYAVAAAGEARSLLNTNYALLVYEADVSLAGSGDAGLLFRSGYFVGIDANADKVFLARAGGSGSAWTELASAPAAIDPGVTYHLKVVANGSHLAVYLADATAATVSVTDAAYATGTTGLLAHTTSATFDNVRVTAPPGAIFYEHGGYGGVGVALSPGSYSLAQLLAAGIGDEWMSSLRVPAGWTVDVFADDHFAGAHWTFTSDTPSVPADANDQMSSVKVVAP